MDSVKLLIQGYAKQLPDGRWDATSATVLVRSGGKRVIIDPGEFPEALQAALEKEGLQISDIDWVVCSHSHGDHRKSSKLFPKDRIFDPFKLYKKIPDNLVIPGTEIKVVHTPGHVDNHIVFIVVTPEGRCGIAADVIWWADNEEQKTDTKSLVEHVDIAAKDMAEMMETRQNFFSMADYIIPGHGKVFKVPKP
jgi:glyoxylase-like metal-dependent hydrolase (beta-lactamase superfamily II)